jgi:hypothetical protein
MKIAICLALGFVTIARAATSDLGAHLSAALARLDSHQTYAWETSIAPASLLRETVPTFNLDHQRPNGSVLSNDSTRYDVDLSPVHTMERTVPISGVTDVRTRSTLITWDFDAVTVGRKNVFEAFTMHVVSRPDGRVVEMPDGWREQAEVERVAAKDAAFFADKAALRSLPQRDSRKLGHGFVGRFLASLHNPAEELRLLLADASAPKGSENTVVCALTEKTSLALWRDLRFRDGAYSSDVLPVSAKGSVAITIRNNEITQYEVTLDGEMAAPADASAVKSQTQTIHLVKTTTLSKFDRARVDIPAAAVAMLDSLHPKA